MKTIPNLRPIISVKSLLLLLCVCLLSGCGKGLVPLKGKVTFSDDGSPVPAGVILFDDGTNAAHGSIQKDGTYTVGSFKTNDGLPKGTYQLTITGAVEITVTETPMPAMPRGVQSSMPLPPTSTVTPLIDPKYEKKSTSGLTFVADGTQKEFNIQVDRFGGAK